MAGYHDCTAKVYANIPNKDVEKIRTWVSRAFAPLFVSHDLIVEESEFAATCRLEKDESGKERTCVSVDMPGLELIDDDPETAGKTLEKLSQKLCERLREVHATGHVNLYGFFSDRDPDISTYDEI